jgi:hypothetical protein
VFAAWRRMVADAALLIAIVIIIALLAILRRSHRKVRELRRSLKKASRLLNL